MRRRNGRVAAAVSALVVTIGLLAVSGPATAAPSVCPSDPPPQVLGLTAQDVSFLAPGPWPEIHVRELNVCGGTSPGHCSSDPTTSCTDVALKLRRSGPLGPLARLCSFSPDLVGISVPTDQPGVFDYKAAVPWTLEANDDYDQPAKTNACAGPWDVVATPRNISKVDGVSTVTVGQPFTATAAFTLYRGSRLTTSATPEPVRPGGTVTVKGRLTRQLLAPDWLSTNAIDEYVGFGDQAVVLQRRTLTGTYNDIRTVRSTTRGYLTTRLAALPEDRCYRWMFRGSSTTKAITAYGDCVHVSGH